MDNTKEIVTVHIPKSRLEKPSDETAAWSSAEVLSDESMGLVTIDHPLRRSLPQRIGHAAYWLTHRQYRREVRERANLIAVDLANGLQEKTLLPPRSRDFHVDKRRRLTADFALDIQRQIKIMRMTRQAIAMFTLSLTDRLHGSSYTMSESPPLDDSSIVPPDVVVVETQVLPLPGYVVGDSDFVPKLINKDIDD